MELLHHTVDFSTPGGYDGDCKGMFGIDRVGPCVAARRAAQSRKRGTGITANNISAPSFSRTTAFAA
ncbi:MAG: hypothetical protein RLY87_101 [Chloroflexota bacterium]